MSRAQREWLYNRHYGMPFKMAAIGRLSPMLNPRYTTIGQFGKSMSGLRNDSVCETG